MRDTIYTIPINDVFAPKCGCPVCHLREMLEKRCIDYIMGAAMMEPDIRIETNKYGFCKEHFAMLSQQKNRLSLALILETHIDELLAKHMPPSVKKGAVPVSETCFVCREIDQAAGKLLDTALKLYHSDSSFRALFLEQEFFCWEHYELLCKKAAETMNRKQAAQFTADLTELVKRYLTGLRGDVHSFSTMFDYRNAESAKNDEAVKTSIERAIRFLE